MFCVLYVCVLYFSVNCVFLFYVLFSTLILLVGSLTCKNCHSYNLYCVGGDVKPINQSTQLIFCSDVIELRDVVDDVTNRRAIGTFV